MITNLLRRLQGRSAPLAPAVRSRVPEAAYADATPVAMLSLVLDAAALEHRFLGWAFDLPQDPSPDDAHRADAAFEHLTRVAERFDVRRMPRLPALVPHLLSEMRRDDVDAAALAAVLARDATLAGDVMRVAGSAFYRRAQPPGGLQQAVQAIGHEGLRHVVLSSVMRPILRGDAGQAGFSSAARLWTHTEATAWLCGRLAAGHAEPSTAQLAGIVSGTGIAALSRMVPPALLADAAADPRFAQRFLALARPLSARAGRHWTLPPAVLDALQATDDDARTGLPMLLRAADRLAMGRCLIGAGRLPADATWPVGLPGYAAIEPRDALFATMSRELEAGAEAAGTAA